MGRLLLDPFLSELTSMFEHNTEKGSVWVTLKRYYLTLPCLLTTSDKSKPQQTKLTANGQKIEYKCLIRASDGTKKISTLVGVKDHQRFQASYATIIKAHMTALKKRERKEKKKTTEVGKKPQGSKKLSSKA